MTNEWGGNVEKPFNVLPNFGIAVLVLPLPALRVLLLPVLLLPLLLPALPVLLALRVLRLPPLPAALPLGAWT